MSDLLIECLAQPQFRSPLSEGRGLKKPGAEVSRLEYSRFKVSSKTESPVIVGPDKGRGGGKRTSPAVYRTNSQKFERGVLFFAHPQNLQPKVNTFPITTSWGGVSASFDATPAIRDTSGGGPEGSTLNNREGLGSLVGSR